jgi:hypothetical protein
MIGKIWVYETNYFNIEKDKITFISDGSDNFSMVKLKDGDTFTLTNINYHIGESDTNE